MSSPPPITGIGLPPAQDRMLTTVFLAALLHGVVILGITFGATREYSSDDAAAGLEVVLVNERAPTAAQNPNARYLSQRTQVGSGNSLQGDRTLIPRSSLMPVDRLGIPNGDGLASVEAGSDAGEDPLIATHAASVKILYFASSNEASQASELPLLLEKRPDVAMTPNDDGVQLRMRGESKHQLWIAADTRESDVAVYLDSWRRKIERVGTMNFPDIARRKKLSGTPVIEVTIGADGKLLNAQVRHTSGHAEIDEAALRILKLAAPYDRFSTELTAKHDEIRIAYEWQFLAGDTQGGGVFYAEPNQPPSP
jgi:protein TonB